MLRIQGQTHKSVATQTTPQQVPDTQANPSQVPDTQANSPQVLDTRADSPRMLDTQANFQNVLEDEELDGTIVKEFCQLATREGFEYCWFYHVCVDKGNKWEIDEAVTAHYELYYCSGACYVWIQEYAEDSTDIFDVFSGSKWFDLSRTLQELLSPSTVIFLSLEWRPFGTKETLAQSIEDTTGIDKKVLTFDTRLEEIPVAIRISWAASRKASRGEDEIYWLMGLFGVRMPLLYGEGRRSAFMRLQAEILRRFPWDHTLLAWGDKDPRNNNESTLQVNNIRLFRLIHSAHIQSILPPPSQRLSVPPLLDQYLFAPSPSCFKGWTSNISPLSRQDVDVTTRFKPSPKAPPTVPIPPSGETIRLPLLELRSRHSADSPTHLALVAYETPDNNGRNIVALLLREDKTAPGNYLVGSFIATPSNKPQGDIATPGATFTRTILLKQEEVEKCHKLVRMTAINILRYPSDEAVDIEEGQDAQSELCLVKNRPFVVKASSYPHPFTIARVDSRDERFSSLTHVNAFDLCKEGNTVAKIGVGRSLDYKPGESDFIGLIVIVTDDKGAEKKWPDEPTRLRDWGFRGGAVSKDIPLEFPVGQQKFRMRLTFHHQSGGQPPPLDSGTCPTEPSLLQGTEYGYRLYVNVLAPKSKPSADQGLR